jgi:hypothetical protein
MLRLFNRGIGKFFKADALRWTMAAKIPDKNLA